MLVAGGLAALVGAKPQAAVAAGAPRDNFAGRLEYEGRSEFSHVCVRRMGDVRSLVFVRDNGDEVLETQVDLRKPYVLKFEYLRYLFASYLFRDQQSDVLIVGLGGGGMVHFLRRYDPQVRIDAVEIDPLIVDIADKYFGVRGGERQHRDGGWVQGHRRGRQDVRRDLHGRLSEAVGPDRRDGAPLELRTRRFYEQMQKRLKPGGLVMLNLNPHEGLAEDMRGIREAFPQAYEFMLPRGEGAVVAASTDANRVGATELVERAKGLERRFEGTVSFREMPKRLKKVEAGTNAALIQPAKVVVRLGIPPLAPPFQGGGERRQEH